MRKSILLIALLLISITICAQKVVKVAAAANLRSVFTGIINKYEKENPGVKIDVTFGSSGSLVQQILNGASYDFFMAADKNFPLKLQEKGVTYGKVTTYVYGKLALWSSTIDVNKGISVLKEDAVKRIAIAKPETAPYGDRAVELLKKQGLFNDFQTKIIYGDNISAAAQYAFTGNAEVGFIALSLAMAPEMLGKGKCYVIPQSMYTPIEQACVLIKKSTRNLAAEKLMKYVLSKSCDSLWDKYGYSK
ncbi:molybdate ABC transporter substrate-binding protein [uncultured Bacteroides sp.]|uniref:molybdate ABC transporter substrate-binding protein n=1 Tax=uncultured Bacteroides sp. TaxID=162156 RepID=UPI002AA82DFC|nr:molybdate ABC transporter substrate-binding protein [uncultured Bacteroides sp.]